MTDTNMNEDTVFCLIEDLKNYIIDKADSDEEKALELLKKLNAYRYYLTLT